MRGSVRYVLTAAVLGLALIVPGEVYAADTERELEAVNEMVDILVRKSKTLEDQLIPGTGYIDESEAFQRYQDYVYLHMVGQYGEAAEGFFALVTMGALGGLGLHTDAEWYLADSLFQMQNFSTAEARLKAISEQPEHPFRSQAVLRLMELYARGSRSDDFYALYERDVLRGRVEATDAVRYALGKAFFNQGELDRAEEQFRTLPEQSAYYAKARYFLGTVKVVEQDLEAALSEFDTAASQSTRTMEDVDVKDLALLAQGRVLFELGRFAEATERYDSVSAESTYNADKLYEIVWTYVKQDDWDSALRAVEIFLLAYPQHHYAAQLKLIQGHLHIAEVKFDSALAQYEKVVNEYAPVRGQFEDLAASADPFAYLKRFVAGNDLGHDLPEYAVALMFQDDDLSSAISLLNDLSSQEVDIGVSESLIRELRSVIEGQASIGGFDQMRYDAILATNQAAEQSLLLLEVEEQWLDDTLSVDRRSRVQPLRERRLALMSAARDSAYQAEAARAALEKHRLAVGAVRRVAVETIEVAAAQANQIAKMRADIEDSATLTDAGRAIMLEDLAYLEGELSESLAGLERLDRELVGIPEPDPATLQVGAQPVEELLAEIERLRHAYADLRPGNRMSDIAEKIDGLHNSLNLVHQRLRKVENGLGDIEVNELIALQSRFENEVSEVASQRANLDDYSDDAQRVSVDITRDGFARIGEFFADSVLKADMGIVDVYWAQKLATVDEISRVNDEKAMLLDELDRRFSLIKEKMAQ